jgi:hypothetical protein
MSAHRIGLDVLSDFRNSTSTLARFSTILDMLNHQEEQRNLLYSSKSFPCNNQPILIGYDLRSNKNRQFAISDKGKLRLVSK